MSNITGSAMWSEWCIAWEKYKKHDDMAFDFYVKSWKKKRNSIDWQILMLFRKKHLKKAKYYLNKSSKALEKYVQSLN